MYDGVGENVYLVGSRSSKITDKINCFNSHNFAKKGSEYISGIPSGQTCTFDFKDIKYAETSWVATMVGLYKKCERETKKLLPINMNGNLRGALNICKLENLFNY